MEIKRVGTVDSQQTSSGQNTTNDVKKQDKQIDFSAQPREEQSNADKLELKTNRSQPTPEIKKSTGHSINEFFKLAGKNIF